MEEIDEIFCIGQKFDERALLRLFKRGRNFLAEGDLTFDRRAVCREGKLDAIERSFVFFVEKEIEIGVHRRAKKRKLAQKRGLPFAVCKYAVYDGGKKIGPIFRLRLNFIGCGEIFYKPDKLV